jgi:anti-sigma regulatory factor (Ser/Thr protein kinase)
MKTLELPATMENLDIGLNFILDELKQAEIDKKTLFQLRLACEEVVVNVINYAYPDSQGSVTISYDFMHETGELDIIISDSGIPFDPLKKEDPDISIPMEDRKIGGLGIFMVRSVMDSLEYSRDNGRNILIMRKSLKK